jgi:16S rRNA U1498 N3-methylase RsmE
LDFKTDCKSADAEKNSINILSYENENNSKFPINNIFKGKAKYNGCNIFIGLEDGFESKEVEFVKSLGIRTVNNILRVETAAVVASILTLNEKVLYAHFRV